MIFLLALLLSLPQGQRAPAPPAPSTLADIRALLATYEKRTAGGKNDPAELRRIAALVVDAARASGTFAVWSEACGITLAAPSESCRSRLTTLLQRSSAPMAQRAVAGAALVRTGAPGAADLFYGAVKGLGPTDLAAIAPHLLALPKPRAVELLTRALSAPGMDDQVKACRALGTLDTGETRQALANAVAAIPPGTPSWLACTVAQARLKEPDAAWKLQGISNYMEGEALLDAADAMVVLGNEEGALYAVRKVMRLGRPQDQLAAARRLATLDRSAATEIVDRALAGKDVTIRAAALEIEPLLRRAPTPSVRAALADPAELVRLRAAAAILAWAERVRQGAVEGALPAASVS